MKTNLVVYSAHSRQLKQNNNWRTDFHSNIIKLNYIYTCPVTVAQACTHTDIHSTKNMMTIHNLLFKTSKFCKHILYYYRLDELSSIYSQFSSPKINRLINVMSMYVGQISEVVN